MSRNSECEVRSSEWRSRSHEQAAIRSPKGFTLLEVLLAMAILAVVMTVIYASFSTSAANIEKAEVLRDETDMARALVDRLSSDIANSFVKQGMNVPTFFQVKPEELVGETTGNGEKVYHDSIAMTTLTNWPRPDSKETELWEVGYFFKEKPEGNGYTLYRREKRELSKDVPPLEGGTEYEITDRVKSLHFRYSENGATWTEDGWDRSRNRTPKEIEIVLILDDGRMYTTKVDIGNS